MATGAVRVTGLRELQRAFRNIDKGLARDFNKTLKEAAEPVRAEAESLALGRIRNMPRSPDWAVPRIGVSGKAIVYIVPRRKNRGNPTRPNLKGLLLSKSYDPALEAKQDGVVKDIENLVDNLADRNGF